MKQLTLEVLDGEYVIHRFSSEKSFPFEALRSSFLSVTKTAEELSIVCDAAIQLEAEESEPGWSCLKVLGPLDFSLTGILAKLSTALAEAGISLFAISTYDTDYILVKSEKLTRAIGTLEARGYNIL